MTKDKLIESVAETIYGFDLGKCDFDDFTKLASKVVSMVERQLTMDGGYVCECGAGIDPAKYGPTHLHDCPANR